MVRRYVPGGASPYFPAHRYHGIPLHRNIQALREAPVDHHVGPGGVARRAIEVEVLTPEHLWATFQTEAEDILKQDGHWIADDRERNRRINAAYARLWLADERFEWAGLAAFASKQVGCGLLHSAEIVERNARQQAVVERSLGHGSVPGVQSGATLKQAMAEAGGSGIYRRLGYGNKHLFLDVYPLHRFYMERGWDEFRTYLSRRQNKRYAVHWDVDRKTLEFGIPFREIFEAFESITDGHILKSVARLARHEQVNILQRIIYDDLTMQCLLAWNQYAWATDMPSGEYEEIQLTLSAQCSAKKGFTAWFSKNTSARLWNPDERMAFVLKAAGQFHQLLGGPARLDVEASIRTIAAAGAMA
jgi:hypothetical protein